MIVAEPTDPHREAEGSLLGAVLLTESAMLGLLADERITANDFRDPVHQVVFRAMVALHNDGSAIDVLTVATKLREMGELDRVGGMPAVDALAGVAPVSGNWRDYARIVKGLSLRRTIANAGRSLQRAAQDPTMPIEDIVDEAESALFSVTAAGETKAVKHIGEVLAPALERYEERRRAGGGIVGVRTGFNSLDEAVGGLRRRGLYVLAARPSMGKTSIMLDWITAAAVVNHKRTLVFSLEMSEDEINDGLVGRQAGISGDHLARGLFNQSKWADIHRAAKLVDEAPIWISDSNATLAEIRTKSRAQAASSGLDLVAIDYLQLIAETGRNRGRVEEVSAFSRGLKMLARELDVPIVALSQLSRKVEDRNDKRPLLSDLKESGQIEADADAVIMVYRPGYYDPDCSNAHVTELLIRKNRQGGQRPIIGLEFTRRGYIDVGVVNGASD